MLPLVCRNDRAAGGEPRERRLDDVHPVGRGIGAVGQFRFQRLDVRIDLDVFAEFVANVPLQPLLPNQGSFESSFFELSRVNDSLKQIILVHGESGRTKSRKTPAKRVRKENVRRF